MIDFIKIDNDLQEYCTIFAAFSQAPLSVRIEKISHFFLEKPFLVSPMGEGPLGEFNQKPIYRFDGFDCVTYVNTVLAFALSQSASEFKTVMMNLNYADSQPDYLTRLHFTELEWNEKLKDLGILRDITAELVPSQQLAYAETQIDKQGWLKKHDASCLYWLVPRHEEAVSHALDELYKRSQAFSKQKQCLPYIPFSALLTEDNQLSEAALKIPPAAIIEIVRPNWDLTATIGTHLNVSHLGFAFWRENQLWFRHASRLSKKVGDDLLATYLHAQRQEPTIAGIHVLSSC